MSDCRFWRLTDEAVAQMIIKVSGSGSTNGVSRSGVFCRFGVPLQLGLK